MSIRTNRLTNLGTIFIGLCLSGCGDDGAPSGVPDQTAGVDALADTSDSEIDVMSQDVAVDVSDSTADTDTSMPTCAPDSLEFCEYPGRQLESTARTGLSVTEPVTGRALPLLVRIPSGAEGPSPVLIWSHGGSFFEGGETQSKQWGELFAAHGFVVIHVGHADLGAGLAALCAAASVPVNECGPEQSAEDGDSGLLAAGRSYDIAAVLDDLPRLSQLSVAAGGPAFDRDRVVVAGWSGGSRGPMLLMGATVRPSATAPLFSNPHAVPAAALFLSPTGPGFGGFYQLAEETSWEALRGPTFMATGANDVKPSSPGLDGPTRRVPFIAQPADGKRVLLYSNLEVGVGGHGTYNLGDIDGEPRLKRLSLALESAARAFVDAAVRDDAAARAWLASDAAGVLAGDAEWRHR